MRYVLIDYMHLAHRCIVAQPLSATVVSEGAVSVIDTTIPNYTIKNIFRYGGKGLFPTGVFFEGGSKYRKEHFAKKGEATPGGYKGGRPQQSGTFFEGINLTTQLLMNGKVSAYRASGYEADDLIFAMIQKIKETDTTTPIDVITNDSDLLPLVDEQVNVYIRGTREFSEPGCPILKLYYQVTPRSWNDYLGYSSAYKGYNIPYNSMLLFKLIRGDKTDNVAGAVAGYGAKKYSEVMEEMQNAVFMDETMKADLFKVFQEKKDILIDKENTLKKVSEVYKKKDADKFIDRLATRIDGVTINPAKELTLRNKLVKEGLEGLINLDEIDIIREDLTNWFTMRSLLLLNINLKLNNKGETSDVLQVEMQRVIQKYVPKEEWLELQTAGVDIEKMFTYGVKFDSIFKYGVDFDAKMAPVLKHWFTETEVADMKFIYQGIGLRYVNLVLPKQIERGYLQSALQPLRINLPK